MIGSIIFKYFSSSPRMYDFCKNYLDKYHNENNCDMRSNGELRVMQEFLPQCKTVFDVGANVGEWTAHALKINPKLAIHCFEPSKDTYKKLLEKKFPKQILCQNIGLSSTKKEEKLFIFDKASGLNSLYKREGLENLGLMPPEQTESIKLDTLENYCNKNNIAQIDFLKIDIEGHELEAFQGGLSLFQNHKIKVVQFEYGGCNIDARVLLKDIFAFFKKNNYSLYKIYPDKIVRIEKYSQRLENFQYQNWCALFSSPKSE